MASSQQMSKAQSSTRTNLPFAPEIRKIIWEYVLQDTVARLPSTSTENPVVGRDAYLAPLYVSKSTRDDTIDMVFEHVTFDLRFLAKPFVNLQNGLEWPSLRCVKSIIIKPEQVGMYQHCSQQAPFDFPYLDILTLFWTPENPSNLRLLADALGDATGDVRRNGIFACFRVAIGPGSRQLDSLMNKLRLCNFVRPQAFSTQAVELRIEIPLAVDATLTVKDPYFGAEWALLRETERVEIVELPTPLAFEIWRMTESAAIGVNPALLNTLERMRLGRELAGRAYHAHQLWLAQQLENGNQNGFQP